MYPNINYYQGFCNLPTVFGIITPLLDFTIHYQTMLHDIQMRASNKSAHFGSGSLNSDLIAMLPPSTMDSGN
jgi:hypothetical protein